MDPKKRTTFKIQRKNFLKKKKKSKKKSRSETDVGAEQEDL
jgi:hypothetical protein